MYRSYISVCIYIFICTYICIYIYVHIYVYIYICIHIYRYTHICTNIHVQCLCTCRYIYIYTYIHYVCLNTSIYIYYYTIIYCVFPFSRWWLHPPYIFAHMFSCLQIRSPNGPGVILTTPLLGGSWNTEIVELPSDNLLHSY